MASASFSTPLTLCSALVLVAACGSGAISSGQRDDASADDDGASQAQCEAETPSQLASLDAAEPWMFQVVGDVHAHRSDARSYTNITTAFADMRATGPAAERLVLNGDLTERGTVDDYNYLKSAMAGGSAPRLYNIGNHEYHGTASSATERQNYLNFTGLPQLYYEHSVRDTPFLFLAGENGDADLPKLAWTAVLSDAQLIWLDERLGELASPEHFSFVFLHQHPDNTTDPARLKQILAAHPNVVLFWSHWHANLHAPEGRYFTTAEGFLSVHTGSVQYTLVNGTPRYNYATGLQVSVFGDRLSVWGRDFAGHAWISAFRKEHSLRPPSAIGALVSDSTGTLVLMVADAEGIHQARGGETEGYQEWTTSAASVGSAPRLVRASDGHLEAFVRRADRAVYRSVQSEPGGEWSEWQSIGGITASNIAVAAHADGRLELFARGGNHALYHSWQETPGGDFGAWIGLGGYFTSDPAVVTHADGRLEVFAAGADSVLHRNVQESAGGETWSGWTSLGLQATSTPAAALLPDGSVTLVASGADRALYAAQEKDGSVGEWQAIGEGSFLGAPALHVLADGRLEVFARGTDSALHRSTQASADSQEWSAWASLGGQLSSDPLVAARADGQLEIVAQGQDGALWSNSRSADGDCWTGWVSTGIAVSGF